MVKYVVKNRFPRFPGSGFVRVIVAYSAVLIKCCLFKICTAINKEEELSEKAIPH